ncbi:hypothetical protein EDB87DRAFT_1679107 [Lactarius vividus]|nr:hypothetical protein EDB87DRAFT_1679107 [Lactarius vividus]
MYAPLALEAPVVLITADHTANGTSSKSYTSLSVVTNGLIGGYGVNGDEKRTSAEPSFPSEVVSVVTVTPFDPTGPITTEMALPLAGPQTDSQQLLFHRPSSPDDSPLPLRRAVTIPVGLSDKELARLRSLETVRVPNLQTDNRLILF